MKRSRSRSVVNIKHANTPLYLFLRSVGNLKVKAGIISKQKNGWYVDDEWEAVCEHYKKMSSSDKKKQKERFAHAKHIAGTFCSFDGDTALFIESKIMELDELLKKIKSNV